MSEALKAAREKLLHIVQIYAPNTDARQNAINVITSTHQEFEAAVREDERALVQDVALKHAASSGLLSPEAINAAAKAFGFELRVDVPEGAPVVPLADANAPRTTQEIWDAQGDKLTQEQREGQERLKAHHETKAAEIETTPPVDDTPAASAEPAANAPLESPIQADAAPAEVPSASKPSRARAKTPNA